MSLEYCHECDKMIDLDTDAEHFEEHIEDRIENEGEPEE